jgi:hypothetical protein
MNLIDEVTRFKDLYEKHLPESPPGSMRYTAEFCQAGINTLPAILDVMGEIRAGDADAISEILSLLEEIADISKEDRELLTRYRDMAQAMEAHR